MQHDRSSRPISCSASSRRHATWVAQAGRPLHVGGTDTGRWLRLREGRLWLTLGATHDSTPAEAETNFWLLHPGQSMRLAPGVGAAVEGWPSARFELIELPQNAAAATSPSAIACASS